MATEMTKAEMQEQMEQLQKELAQKEERLEAMEKEKAETAIEPAASEDENPSRRVKIQLFKDNDRYKEPLFVQVNDYRAAIPRGVVVEVPYFVAEHIKEMQAQDAGTAMMVQVLASEYEQRSKIMG